MQGLSAALFQALYHRHNGFVVRRRDAQRLGFSHQSAVQRIDLGTAALLDVLHHRGLVVADAAMVLDLSAWVLLRKFEFLVLHHQHDLVDDPVLQCAEFRRSIDLAATQAGDRRECIDAAVQHKLAPDPVHRIGNDFGRDSGLVEHLRDQLHALRVATVEFADGCHADVGIRRSAGRGVGCAVHGNTGNHPFPAQFVDQRLDVADAVLQGQCESVGLQ